MIQVTDIEEKTHVGILPALTFLRLTNEKGRDLQNFQLRGESWIGGRDTSCSIFIDNPRVSRRQFELGKQDDQFFIRDLGSVNPTLLNGRALPSDEWTVISSGDQIGVGDWALHFEQKDASFDQRVRELAPLSEVHEHFTPAQASDFAPPHSASGPIFNTDLPPAPSSRGLLGQTLPALNPVRILILALVVFGGGFALYNEFFPSSGGTPVARKAATPFEKLTPDKQQLVKQWYLLAQSFLAEEKYQNAQNEVRKIHELIPYYEDTKEIQERAQQGLDILFERQRAEKEEQKAREIEYKIQTQVSECQKTIPRDVQLGWAELCLASVLEFNPEHPAFNELKLKVAKIVEDREFKLAQDKMYREQVSARRALFEKAVKIEQEGLPIPSIEAYERVVKSRLPDPEKLIEKAKEKIISLQKVLDGAQADSEKKADAAAQSGNLKKAILELQRGMKINPDNEVLKGRHTELLSTLKKNMQAFYQEAIIEESVGNVAAAKEKWQKILDQSLPGEDYFEKSRLKMKKYGAL